MTWWCWGVVMVSSHTVVMLHTSIPVLWIWVKLIFWQGLFLIFRLSLLIWKDTFLKLNLILSFMVNLQIQLNLVLSQNHNITRKVYYYSLIETPTVRNVQSILNIQSRFTDQQSLQQHISLRLFVHNGKWSICNTQKMLNLLSCRCLCSWVSWPHTTPVVIAVGGYPQSGYAELDASLLPPNGDDPYRNTPSPGMQALPQDRYGERAKKSRVGAGPGLNRESCCV